MAKLAENECNFNLRRKAIKELESREQAYCDCFKRRRRNKLIKWLQFFVVLVYRPTYSKWPKDRYSFRLCRKWTSYCSENQASTFSLPHLHIFHCSLDSTFLLNYALQRSLCSLQEKPIRRPIIYISYKYRFRWYANITYSCGIVHNIVQYYIYMLLDTERSAQIGSSRSDRTDCSASSIFAPRSIGLGLLLRVLGDTL